MPALEEHFERRAHPGVLAAMTRVTFWSYVALVWLATCIAIAVLLLS